MKSTRTLLHRSLALLLAVCLLAAALPVQALAAGAAEYETYQTENGGFLRVNRFTNTLDGAVNISGDLVIPREVGTASVNHIADRVFYGCEDLKSVTIPASVQTIGDEAFGACTALKKVKLSEGLVSLGKQAFRYCYSLTDINLPASLTSIENYCFSSCLALQSIVIPSGVKNIGTYAFADCKKLTSITLPDSVETIGEYAFAGCIVLPSITLPKNLKDIRTALFSKCTSLTTAVVQNKVVSVGENAFGGCTALKKLILPEGVQRIEQWAFSGCSSLETLSIPASVTSISADAFYGCDKVTLYVKGATLAQMFADANKMDFVIGTLDGEGQGTVYPDTPFTDVKDHWAEDQIKWAYDKQYFKGMTETKFSPDSPVNRGMLVSVLYRLEGEPAVGASGFTDVAPKSYYASAVAWGESAGIVTGMGDGKFMPSRNITREQLATMLYRYALYKKMDVSKQGDLSGYRDTGKIGSFAGTAMAWAVGEKIVGGVTAATLDPKGSATRAQTVVMLKRFVDLT